MLKGMSGSFTKVLKGCKLQSKNRCEGCSGAVIPTASQGNLALRIHQLVCERDACLTDSGY
jgi:hypothetical protein